MDTVNSYSSDIETQFKLPIYYNDMKKHLQDNIINDLELTKTVDKTERSIYTYIFTPSNCFGEIMLESCSKYYTTDVSFLKDTQIMLKSYGDREMNIKEDVTNFTIPDFDSIFTAWKEIKGETSFCEKYLYIDWDFCKFLNKNSMFLQAMSMYNIISPIISLFLPIFILIIPFFIIKLKGLTLSMNEYADILKIIISNHAIGKIFTSFHEVDMNQKLYLLISAAFYIFSIYQNILTCIKFYVNTKKIHYYLSLFKEYLHYTVHSMENHLEITKHLGNYANFNDVLNKNKEILLQLHHKLVRISPLNMSLVKLLEIGDVLHCFYEIYDNEQYNAAFLYSFGFHGYINNIDGLKQNILEKHINFCNFDNNKRIKQNTNHKEKKQKRKNIFKSAYYPNLISKKHVKNTCNLQTNMLITGPNASGKTTLLKTILINTILSQQFGCGCYKKANFVPYDFLHCYLNIPDTSSRDSLFQAEARRCKEIIDCINENENKTHLCIFDELYSGTNPEEATISAIAFMEYLVKKQNVTCLLTTHYINVCKTLEDNIHITNCNMKTIIEKDKLQYKYEIQKGISEIKGGLQVLFEMNYPREIIDKTKEI